MRIQSELHATVVSFWSCLRPAHRVNDTRGARDAEPQERCKVVRTTSGPTAKFFIPDKPLGSPLSLRARCRVDVRAWITGRAAYNGINDALFSIFYTAFTVGLICYGIAFLRTNGSMSQLGILFTVWALLNLPGWIDAVTGSELLGRYFEWVGPVFQPIARAWVGFWLWRNAGWAFASVTQSGCAPLRRVETLNR